MSVENHEPKAVSNMDALKQQAEACGAGCCCHAGESSGRTRWVLGVVILLFAAVLLVRAVLRSSARASSEAASAAVFAVPAEAGDALVVTPGPVSAPAPTTPTPAARGVVGTEIAAFSELNTLAADTTAVFVFVPSKDPEATAPPTAHMEAAARTIAAQGNNKVALFTIKAGSADYEQILGQVTPPGVMALVKGKGMNAVSGEITETTLVQAFVAASNAGGCGAGGCEPGTPGCK